MASSLEPKKIYDVFLSFRGADLRNNFIGHLYQALHRDGVYTFQDSEELKKGDQISPVLMKAIEESCIAIIVFSEDYASSRWCLEELAKIIECKEQKNLIVLPVFYKVDPREVREGRKSYKTSLAKHEFKLGNDSEKVKRWKKALSDVGNLSGWHLNNGDESKLIQEIVNKISTYLDRPLSVAKHPVGIYSQVIKLKSILKVESNDGVLMVGLWGQGGIGKTCLAKALYNALFKKFEGACFLANVRETSKDSRGLVTLQEIMLNDILLPQQRLKVSNVDEGINLIQRRLGRKKVLLILDDVDALCQLDALARKGEWFGNGSRIIVATRDKQLLTCHRIDQDHVYKVEPLSNRQAHELLSKHAFQTHQIKTDLVDGALEYAKGLPLALEVLGSLLCGTTEDVWESTIKKLSRNPDKNINNVLKVSFDGLDENEKEIFLHIACFFKGWARECTKKVLDSCDLETIVGFDVLIKRSLISLEHGIIRMHDLIQAMGMDIVNQECRDDPTRRSKLWLYDDVIDVLSRDMGDYAVKAIVLALPKPTEMHINPDAFTKLRRLRLLILHNVHSSVQGPICLPSELRWFEWPGCAHGIPKFSASAKKLVGLNMSEGNITEILKQFKAFQNLKYINFSHCELMVRMPNLSCTPNLEELDFSNCKNLVEAHESIAYLDKLQVLNFSKCRELSVFPNVLKSKNLQVLDFNHCTKFERFPDIPNKLEDLEELFLEGIAIRELPTSIENLVALKRMYIHDCKNLEHLPSNIYKLQNLENLEVQHCTNLIEFPQYENSVDSCMKAGLSNLRQLNLAGCNLSQVEFLENLSCFPLLECLFLAGNNMTTLPSFNNKRDRLYRLEVQDCHQLQEILKLPSFLTYFLASNCESLQKKEDLTTIHSFLHGDLANMVPGSHDLCWPIFKFLPGGEMPQWVLPIEEGFLSFMASKDLYDKILGLVLCFVLNTNDEPFRLSAIHIESHVNGERQPLDFTVEHFGPLDMVHLEITYTLSSKLWRVVDFFQIDRRYIQFDLTISGDDLKKLGVRIICKQLGEDLKDELRDNQLIDPTLLYEVSNELTDSPAESSLMHEDNSSIVDRLEDLQDSQMGTEEHSHTGSKRNHESVLTQGMRTKIISTSSSTGRDENGGVGLQLLLLE